MVQFIASPEVLKGFEDVIRIHFKAKTHQISLGLLLVMVMQHM